MSAFGPVPNYGRVRRLTNRYCWGIQQQIERLKESENEMLRERDENQLGFANYTNKNDWEVVLMFLTRLRRCLNLLQNLGPGIQLDDKFIEKFENCIPDLK